MTEKVTSSKKFSEIVSDLARSLFKSPAATPESYAIHVALLLTHVGWNRSIGHEFDKRTYSQVLAVFKQERPNVMDDFIVKDVDELIELAVDFKKRQYPLDRRVILACGMVEDRVRVEWCDEKEMKRV